MTTPDQTATPAAGSPGPAVPVAPGSPLGRYLAGAATGTVPPARDLAAIPTALDDPADEDTWRQAVEAYAEAIARTVRAGDEAKARAMVGEIPAELAAGLPQRDQPTDDAPATVADRVRR